MKMAAYWTLLALLVLLTVSTVHVTGEPVTFSLPGERLNVQENAGFIIVCVTKTGLTEQTFRGVLIFTSDIQAASNFDYIPTNNVLTFAPEDTVQCINIAILADEIVEQPENFAINLELDSQDIDATVNQSVVIVEIIDNNFVDCDERTFQCSQDAFCIPQSYVCDGIKDCLFSDDEANCNTSDPCNHGEIRLIGGSTPGEGLVEACFEESFGTACLSGLNIVDSAVVCKALNFPGAGVWVNSLREFGIVGSGPIFVTNLDCRGNETHPFECRIEQGNDDCSHQNDAGIRCLVEPACEHGSIRLMGGKEENEGKVEVCYQGLWGSVVSQSWGFEEASVVCGALGRDRYGALPIPRFSYSNRVDEIIINSVECGGSENSLFQCTLNFPNGKIEDDYVVGVRCDDLLAVGCTDGDVRLVARESAVSGQVQVCTNNMWGRVCSSSWGINEAMVVCRQLNHSVSSGSAFSIALGNQSIPIVLEYLDCRGNEINLLECPRIPFNRRKRQGQMCSAEFEAGVRCAEPPQILLIPPSPSRSYDIEVGRDTRIGCLLEPNLYPQPFSFTSHRVDGNDTIISSNSEGDRVFVVRSSDDSGVGVEATGNYVCRAEYEDGGAVEQRLSINVQEPIGSRSRIFLRYSLPDRLIELRLHTLEHLILTGIDPDTPGQQLVQCNTVDRTLMDQVRRRDRFECILENYPPLNDDPTAVARFVVQYLNASNIAFSSFRISALGFCDSEIREYGIWPETEANSGVTIPCEGGVATRFCSPDNDGQWMEPNRNQCTGVGPTQDPTKPIPYCCQSEDLCISQDKVCDGIAHCLFLEDESNCPPVVTNCKNGSVRLSLGLSNNEGVVELCLDGVYGGLCGDEFTLKNAEVVCKQLGLPEGAVLLHDTIISIMPTLPLRLTCSGSENSLLECEHIDYFLPEGAFPPPCAVHDPAAIRCEVPKNCQDGDLRLAGGRNTQEGNLQICLNGVWGSVCGAREFSFTEASVVCTQIGYNPTGALLLPTGYFPEGVDTSFQWYVSCSVDEVHNILECYGHDGGGGNEGDDNEDGSDDDSDDDDECLPVALRCDDYPQDECESGAVRLLNRDYPGRGIVEVCLERQWGTLCSTAFSTLNEAPVVCRQLGFIPDGSFTTAEGVYLSVGVPHIGSFRCLGNESSLLHCEFNSSDINQREKRIVACFEVTAVVCSTPPSLFLNPPPSGSSNTYVVEVGHPLQVKCSTANSFPPSTVIGFRVRIEDGTKVCRAREETESLDVTILDYDSVGVLPSVAGDYQCVACNSLGTVTENFTVVILSPEGEGSSVYLRLSVPVLNRLSTILDSVTDVNLLRLLQTEILSSEVIQNEDGIQTAECLYVGRRPVDVDARRDRFECKITTHPQSNTYLQLANRVANELRRNNVAYSDVKTSEDGFCSAITTLSPEGIYDWPEVKAGETASLPCAIQSTIGGMAQRVCNSNGQHMLKLEACQRELDISEEGLEITSFTLPHLPLENNGVYRFSTGSEMQIQCSRNNFNVSWQRQDGADSRLIRHNEQGFESPVLEINVDIFNDGLRPDDAGVYICNGINEDRNSVHYQTRITISVFVPDGKERSATVRFSIASLSTIDMIVNESISAERAITELERIFRFGGYQRNNTMTVACAFVERRPMDIDNDWLRIECLLSDGSDNEDFQNVAKEIGDSLSSPSVLPPGIFITGSLNISETGFCGYELDDTAWGRYNWPESVGGKVVTFMCQQSLDEPIIVTRKCANDGEWDAADYEDCAGTLLTQLSANITKDNLGERTAMVAEVVQEAEQTENNAQLVRNVVQATAAFARSDPSVVDEETVDGVVDILNGLQEWPPRVIQNNNTGAEIVQSFEDIAISLVQQENFTELTVTNENIAVRIERVDIDDITTGRSFGVSEEDGGLATTVGNESGLASDQIASGFLPQSLFDKIRDEVDTMPIVFSVILNGSLFSLNGQNEESSGGMMTLVGSPVVSLTVAVPGKTFENLQDPVIVNVRILVKNFENPRCVSYDFEQQAWVTDGCTTVKTEDGNQTLITCKCDHLTNFASLVDICSRTEEGRCGQNDDAKLALDIISIIGVILSGLGLIFTVITFLLFKKLRSRDTAKFHVQLCLALLGMLLVFVVGIDRTEVFEGCVTVSVLIHYFTLVAVMWMGAEAVLIYRKLVLVFVQITTRFIIIVSLICWLTPIVPVVVPAVIDPHFMITDTDSNHFCFISDVRVFFGAFLGPLFAVLVFNTIIFVIVIGVLIKHSRNKVGRTTDAKSQQKTNIRLAFSLLGIMFLFGITWVLAAFTIREASLTFQILFAAVNSLQGFFVFIFFCVLSSEVRQLWLEKLTCGRYGQKPTYSSGSKGHNIGQLRSGAKTSQKTASSGLISTPSAPHSTSSGIALSEYPSSTVMDNEYAISTTEREHNFNVPTTTGAQANRSRAHFFKNPYTKEGDAAMSSRNGNDSMEASITFNEYRYPMK